MGKIAPAKYPNFKLDEHHTGKVVDIVHEGGTMLRLQKYNLMMEGIRKFQRLMAQLLEDPIEVGTKHKLQRQEIS